MMDFETAMRSRFSCRKMTSEPISEEKLQFIIEAGRLAPLAAGDNKTSHLTVVHGGKLIEDIREACMYTRKDGSRMDPLYGASTIIFFSATDISDDHIEYANAGCVYRKYVSGCRFNGSWKLLHMGLSEKAAETSGIDRGAPSP